MAGEVRLDLQVGLDLAYLRNQLSTVGTKLGGQQVTIPVVFNRQDLVTKTRALERYIGGKKFNVEINTNLQAEIRYAQRLASELAKVQQIAQGARGAFPVGTTQLSKTASKGGVDVKQIQQLYEALAIAGIEGFERGTKKTRAQMVAQIGTVSKDVIAGLLNGLSSGNPQLQDAAQSLGETLIKTMKTVLGIASPSREFRKIGENIGEGLENGMMSSVDKAFDSVEKLMRQRMRILDTIARGVFRMLGMDPVTMREEARQRRLPPAINWPAQTPPSRPFTGPSSTGRMLPPGAIPSLLPGTSFAQQKRLVGDILSPSLKEALRGAANAFVDSVRASLNSAVRQVSVRDLGNTVQRTLQAQRIAGLLPPGVGRTPSVYATGAVGGETRAAMFARREQEARVRSALRGVGLGQHFTERPRLPGTTFMGDEFTAGGGRDRVRGVGQPPERGGALVPYTPTAPSSALPRAYFTGMQFANALKGSEALLNKARIPLASAMQELGGEFAEATKQVLLYGTAYKALAFVMDLPRQTLAAATALQTFRNQLLAITGSAEAADRSFSFVDNLANRFAVPLESARTGFTRLYASMAPAGFNAQEIENLFTGVSKASATFGLSADKVDRVTYALSQMGSKGQIMAEELRGQLGDVLPGAMAIFAEAAQMDIPTFTKAMEAGAFKGEAMRTVLNNVAVLMNTKFADGAAGASKTLQGSLNQMQTGLQRFYEAFEPVVATLVTSFAPVIQETMRNATIAITALADKSGSAMQSIPASARPLLTLFQQLGSILQNTGQALLNFGGVFSGVGAVIVPVVQLMSQFIAIPIVGRVAGYIATIALLTSAFKLLASTGILSATAAMVRWIVTLNVAQVRAYIAGLLTMIRTLFSLTTAMKAAELGFIALKVAALGIVAGAVLVGFDLLVSKIMGVNQALADTKNKAVGAAQAIRGMSQVEARQAAQQAQSDVRALQSASMQPQVSGPGSTLTRKGFVRLNAQQQEAYKRAGLMPIESRDRQTGETVQLGRVELLRSAIEARQGMMREAEYRERQVRFEGGQQATLAPVTLQPAASAARKRKGTKSLDELIGGDIERRMRQAQAGVGLDVARRMGAAGESEQAQRMVKFYEKYRNIAIELSAVQETMATVDKQRPSLIKLGIDPTEKIANLKSKEKELAFELAEAMQLQYNESAKYYKSIEGLQQGFAKDLENIRIQNGLIPKEQARQIELARQYEDIIARYPFLTEEQKISLRKAIYTQIQDTDYLSSALKEANDNLAKLGDARYQATEAARSIGDAFGNAFKGIITGSMTAQEALAGMFQSIADSFADMVAKMIAEWMKAQVLGIFQNLFSAIIPGAGALAGAFGASGPSFNSSVFSGPALSFGAGFGAAGAPNLSGAFGGPANVSTAFSGVKLFATGGIVTGPTLGLIGEGRYNEAVVPLPDGRSIPVELAGRSNGGNVNVVVNVDAKGSEVAGNEPDANQLGRAISVAVQSEIMKQQRPGGLLSSTRR